MSKAKGSNSNQPRCKGVRLDGQLCTAPALLSGWCFAHSPELKAKREAARRQGGKNRAGVVRMRGLVPPRLASVYDQLEAALGEVHGETLSAGRALAMAALARAMVAVLQAGELEERVRKLEGSQ